MKYELSRLPMIVDSIIFGMAFGFVSHIWTGLFFQFFISHPINWNNLYPIHIVQYTYYMMRSMEKLKIQQIRTKSLTAAGGKFLILSS